MLTRAEVARTIGRVLGEGRPLEAERIGVGEERAALPAAGPPPVCADGIVAAHRAMEAEPEPVVPGFEALVGRPARTFRQRVEDRLAAAR